MKTLQDFSLYTIDWNLTPEQAVTLYLEWGNNDWNAEYPPVRSKDDVAQYFVVDTWGDKPMLRLVRRNSEAAEDLFSMPLPPAMAHDFRSEHGNWRGIATPTPAIKDWLRTELDQKY